MNVIFTDIDGVLQTNNPKKWNRKCCTLYANICKELNLKPVITSTWRVRYKIRELQQIFLEQGIEIELYSYTEVLGIERGEEIAIWLSKNDVDNYCVIDDNVRDISPFVNNVVAVKYSYDGLTSDNVEQIRKIFKNV